MAFTIPENRNGTLTTTFFSPVNSRLFPSNVGTSFLKDMAEFRLLGITYQI